MPNVENVNIRQAVDNVDAVIDGIQQQIASEQAHPTTNDTAGGGIRLTTAGNTPVEDRACACANCADIYPESDLQWTPNDERYCNSCFEEYWQYCGDCENIISVDTVRCPSCEDSESFDEVVEESVFTTPQRPHNPTRPRNNDKLIGKRKGRILKTLRIIGVEMEFICEGGYRELEVLKNKGTLPKSVGITGDGSLGAGGIEIITPKIAGGVGEKHIKKICKALRSVEAYADKTCGLHVHIDGGKAFAFQVEDKPHIEIAKLEKELKGLHFALNSLGNSKKLQRVKHHAFNEIYRQRMGQGTYIDQDTNYTTSGAGMPIEVAHEMQAREYEASLEEQNQIAEKVSIAYSHLQDMIREKESETHKARSRAENKYNKQILNLNMGLITSNVKNLWIFHTVFEDTILSFLPRSRRNSNYARLMKHSFNVGDIEGCKSLPEIEALYYKSKDRAEISVRKTKRYEDTRYQGVNFHSLFKDQNIEIRYHSGTLNPTKILEWAFLHCRILDFIEENKINSGTLKNVAYIINSDEKLNKFFEILKLPDKSEAYFRGRVDKFKTLEQADADEETVKCVE